MVEKIQTLSHEELLKNAKRQRVLGTIKNVLIYIMLSIWAIAVLFPFYYMIITAFKTFGSYNAERVPSLFINHFTVSNFISAFTEVNLLGYLWNTLFFTVITTLIMVVVSVLAAYAFSRLEFKGKELVFTLFLALMMIPSELVVITNYVTITELNLRNTFTGLILPSVTSVFYIYLLRENFSQIPDNLYLAAKVDGTGDFKYLCRVVVPICKPTIITVIILKIIECWNSFVWPRLITDNEAYYLISNGIQAIRESGFGRENVPAMMAAVVIVSLPLIVLFLIFRNKIMEGVARGGTKG